MKIAVIVKMRVFFLSFLLFMLLAKVCQNFFRQFLEHKLKFHQIFTFMVNF